MYRLMPVLLPLGVVVAAFTFVVVPNEAIGESIPRSTLPALASRVDTPAIEYGGAHIVVSETPKQKTPIVRHDVPQVMRVSTQSSTGAIRVRATGYCSCAKCCGKSNGITASGVKAAWGTIAAPKSYPFGSRFVIPELDGQIFTVHDRGGSIKGNRIDIWFPTHAQAIRWGVRTVTLIPVRSE